MRLIEITNDDSFNQVMAGIEQKAKDGVAFQTKVRDAAESMPELFAKQRQLEDWMRKKLKHVSTIPDIILQKYKSELSEVFKEYVPDINILEVLYFNASSKDPHGYKKPPDSGVEERNTEICDAFIERHREDIKDAIISWIGAFKSLAAEAKELNWPTGKGSYQHPSVSRFSSDYHTAKRIEDEAKYW